MASCVEMCPGCPFDFGKELTEQAQNYGCLPAPHEIRNMRVYHGKTWACHDDETKPCRGAIDWLAEAHLPYHVKDKNLVTLDQDWSKWTESA